MILFFKVERPMLCSPVTTDVNFISFVFSYRNFFKSVSSSQNFYQEKNCAHQESNLDRANNPSCDGCTLLLPLHHERLFFSRFFFFFFFLVTLVCASRLFVFVLFTSLFCLSFIISFGLSLTNWKTRET